MTTFLVEHRRITVSEYQNLRRTTSWPSLNDSSVSIGLSNDLFSVVVISQEKTIGIGRVIGDGAIYFYIQDVIVHPEYQKMKV